MTTLSEFDWDNAKSEATLAKRGFDFERASLIFDGPVMEEPDRRRDYSEVRIRAIGEIGGRVLMVVYTDRGEVRRIISARLANRRERAEWRLFVKP
jgi:uncharacterized DUF497 family protein